MATKPFTVNINRVDPYKGYLFAVFLEKSTSPVALVSKVTGLKRSNDVIDYKCGGDPIIRKGLGRMKYEPITMERGVTHDTSFEEWANAAQVLDKGSPSASLQSLRQNIRIELRNEAGQTVIRYNVYNAWVSEFQALSDLDGGGNAYALEHVKIECEGWERDLTVGEPLEP